MMRIDRLRALGLVLTFAIAPGIALLASKTGIMVRQGSAAHLAVAIVLTIFVVGAILVWWTSMVKANTDQ